MSQAVSPQKTRVVVTGSRTIPTKPYGNEKWELTLERFLDDDQIIGQELFDIMGEMLTDALDTRERKALAHANQS